MALSLQECIDKIKKEYPNHYPYTYVESEGKYVFNLIAKGANPESAISDMHVVDPETGYVSGGISIMEFLKNKGFREAWKHANLVAHHDESIGHSAIRSPMERGWSVRRNQNGRTANESRPFSNLSSARMANDDLIYGGSLMHHGIKGQHWGTRNGPPYPLDQKTHNQVVKNAGKTPKATTGETGDGKTGLIPELTVLVSYLAIQAYVSSDRFQKKQKRKAQSRFNEKNTDLSKDLLGDFADVGTKYSEDNPPPKIEGEHSIEDDMAACNPRYNDGVVPGTSNNCALCALTYDLRRRGYDVTALASTTGNYPDTICETLYKDAKPEKMQARSFSDLFEKAAKTYPEGARGELALFGPFMGHSVAWEIRNGKLEVLDPQRNVKMTAQDIAGFGFDSNSRFQAFIRTDNLELNFEGVNLVSAGYKPEGKKILAEEKRKKEEASNIKITIEKKSDSNTKGLSEAERRKNYEEAYLKAHPNADKNSKGLKNWVDAQLKK